MFSHSSSPLCTPICISLNFAEVRSRFWLPCARRRGLAAAGAPHALGFPSLFILLPRVYTSKRCGSHTSAQPLQARCPPIELPFVVSHSSAAFLHVCGRAQLPPSRTSTGRCAGTICFNLCPGLEGDPCETPTDCCHHSLRDEVKDRAASPRVTPHLNLTFLHCLHQKPPKKPRAVLAPPLSPSQPGCLPRALRAPPAPLRPPHPARAGGREAGAGSPPAGGAGAARGAPGPSSRLPPRGAAGGGGAAEGRA